MARPCKTGHCLFVAMLVFACALIVLLTTRQPSSPATAETPAKGSGRPAKASSGTQETSRRQTTPPGGDKKYRATSTTKNAPSQPDAHLKLAKEKFKSSPFGVWEDLVFVNESSLDLLAIVNLKSSKCFVLRAANDVGDRLLSGELSSEDYSVLGPLAADEAAKTHAGSKMITEFCGNKTTYRITPNDDSDANNAEKPGQADSRNHQRMQPATSETKRGTTAASDKAYRLNSTSKGERQTPTEASRLKPLS